jgi:DNA-binding response OmpR family regulator
MSRQSADTPHYAGYSLTSTLQHSESNVHQLENLWGYDYDGFDRTVDAHIVGRRKMPGDVGAKIVIVWGVGYCFAD